MEFIFFDKDVTKDSTFKMDKDDLKSQSSPWFENLWKLGVFKANSTGTEHSISCFQMHWMMSHCPPTP